MTKPVRTARNANEVVQYLICEDQILEGIWSAKSLLADNRFSSWQLIFHDDGTLSVGSVGLLQAHFPDCTIIRRHAADIEVPAKLPEKCRFQRSNDPLGLKLFDFLFYAEGRSFLAVDTDVLFFEALDEIHEELTRPSPSIRWNNDAQTAVSFVFSPNEIREKTGIFPVRFNSGLMLYPSRKLNFDLLEKWLTDLGNPDHRLVEQTLYGLMAFHSNGNPLSSKYCVLEVGWPNVVSCHYYYLARRNMYRVGYPALLASGRLAYCS